MAGDDNTKNVYKEEVTKNGAMIEVVLEEAKKKKRPTSARSRPGSATSIRSLEDIERMQKVINTYFIQNLKVLKLGS